jgi:hypothetical protein
LPWLRKIFLAGNGLELLDVKGRKPRCIFWTYSLAMATKDALGRIGDHYSAFSLLKDTPDTYWDAEPAEGTPILVYPNDVHS